MARSPEEERDVLGLVGGLLGLSSGDRTSLGARLADCGRLFAAVVNICANISLVTTTGVELCTDRSAETERASITAFLFSVSVINLVKAVSLLMQWRRLRRLVGVLEAIRRSFRDPEGARGRYSRHATVLGRTWVVMATMNVTFWCLDPLISQALGAAEQGRQLPLPLWLPFDQTQPSNYGLLFLLESAMLMSGVQLSLFIDALFVTLIINVTAEIHVLNSNIQNMKTATVRVAGPQSMTAASSFIGTAQNMAIGDESTLIATSTRPDSGCINFSTSDFTSTYPNHKKSANDEMYQLLVENIRHHQLIIVCVSELEKAVSMGAFALLSINILNLCSHIFSLVVMLERDTSVSARTKMFLAVPIFMCQSGLYCLTGQAIIDESERLVNSAFSCGWPDADERFKRSLRVFMVRAAQPLHIRVGKLISLSRATFQELLKGSYQLFNVVYQFHTN
ncbi:odorant receptor 83a-like [Schistocerca cancellata]|uniref:odorant receptor 83a-like n=1 Tax=Schistocerca cancellata TaxID=274614 RepID=UPI0021181740|nr:odorant receptor 83a-like [Schistocerca cancellata]